MDLDLCMMCVLSSLIYKLLGCYSKYVVYKVLGGIMLELCDKKTTQHLVQCKKVKCRVGVVDEKKSMETGMVGVLWLHSVSETNNCVNT